MAIIKKVSLFNALVLLFAFIFILGFCGTGEAAEKAQKEAVPKSLKCEATIEWEVTPNAEVTHFECFIGGFKGKPTLQYRIEILNTTEAPNRYRVHILNPEGKSVGGLVPRKGNPPAVKPNDKASFTYPVAGYKEVPKNLKIAVKEVSQ